MHSRWPRLDGLAYGGDYNPEQWPEEVWEQDVALMREAGVTLVSVGIFSWGMLEPQPGLYDFGWLDRVLKLLYDAGIAVDLGTPTAAPPPWFLHRHPEARPVTREGLTLGGGSRQAYCPSSPAYGAAAASVTKQLALRYGIHPAVVLWHVNNEYGAPLGECYCETSAAAFRDWLRERYGDLAVLNEHWGAAFWSQRYFSWDEVDVPRASTSVVNPAQRLDFARFSSDALLTCFRRERDILRELAPGVPITTNFMANNCKSVDYWRWAPEVDVISNDNYLIAERTDSYLDLAMSADLSRSLAGGGSWLLMEHSTSAVSWQPRNVAKRSGEMRRNSLAHVARGADGVLFFQWRASRFGAEKHHSAMLPQGGTNTRIWREVVSLGGELAGLGELRGTRVEADIAMIWDWESWWAQELEWRPSVDLGYLERVRAWYEASWRAGLTAEFVHPDGDLTGYRLVVVPSLYLTTPSAADNLRRYVADGGTLLVSCFSGIVDAWDRVHPGPHPGALRDVLGVTVEEWLPLRAGEHARLIWEEGGADATGWAQTWTEVVKLTGAKPVAGYASGPAAGGPAVTRYELGEGQAWYVSACTDAATTAALLAAACESAGVAPAGGTAAGPGGGWPRDLEVVRRADGARRFVVLINHGEESADVMVGGRLVVVPGGDVLVIKGELPNETRTPHRGHRGQPGLQGRSEVRSIIGRKQAAASAAPAGSDIGDLPSRDRHGRARRLGALLAGLSLCSLLVAASAAQAGPAAAAGSPLGSSHVPTVNWALSGQATATTSQSGNPPANAIDGNAATSWCTDSYPDTLTVDLGQARNLDGIGITLDNASSSANATISLATAQGDWRTLPTARNIALDAGNPMYVPLGPSSGNGTPPGMSGRYAQIEVWDSGATPVCIGEFRLFGPDPAAASMMLGSDLSFTPQELNAGAVFTDNGVPGNPANITAHNGAGWARLRLWVNPPAGYSDLADDLAFAKTVKAAGLKLYLDLHYSDFWADPGKQCIPAGWPTTLSGLTAKVQSYTQGVIAAFAAQGTPVDMVSIGNEITNGMLWSQSEETNWTSFGCTGPGVGGLTWTSNTTATGWSNLAQLLKAGVAGAQAGNRPGHKLLIAIHTDLGGNNARAQVFYSNLEAQGVPFDVIGLSYYPVFQGSLAGLRSNVDELATQFHKPIVIAETEYSWTLANGDGLGNTTWEASQLIDGYPASPGGQLSMLNDELSILAAVPDGLGAGMFYWAPEWLPGVSWAPDASPPGTPDDNETLFNFQGQALPSIGMYSDPVQICTHSNPYSTPCVIGS